MILKLTGSIQTTGLVYPHKTGLSWVGPGVWFYILAHFVPNGLGFN